MVRFWTGQSKNYFEGGILEIYLGQLKSCGRHRLLIRREIDGTSIQLKTDLYLLFTVLNASHSVWKSWMVLEKIVQVLSFIIWISFLLFHFLSYFEYFFSVLFKTIYIFCFRCCCNKQYTICVYNLEGGGEMWISSICVFVQH